MNVAMLDDRELRSVTVVDHSEGWSEEEYFALGSTHNRVELVDGGFWGSPAPSMPHQRISFLLMMSIWPAVRTAGLVGYEAINVRLRTGRLLIPDLAICRGPHVSKVAEAQNAVLVGEITSESNAAVDRGQKMEFYAEAGIPWYLLVEPVLPDCESITLRLFRLANEKYTEHAVASGDGTLRSAEPFPFEIPIGSLLNY